MKTPRFVEVDGFRLPPTFDPETFRAACKFEPGEGQVVVATFPKCGTTWTLQIVTLILRRGIPPANTREYFSLVPFLEMTPLDQLQNLRENGGCIKTHLPFDRIAFCERTKYIYVARHPADCAVSFYHHLRYFPVYRFADGSFDDFFEVFIAGNNDFGDYFDNLLSWYDRRREPNVFFVTFEDLKSDPKKMVLEIAKFLGEEYHDSLLANDGEVLDRILEYSSVGYMKNTVDKYYDEIFNSIPCEEAQRANPVLRNYARLWKEAIEAGHQSVGNFVRKGGIGEGKITLSLDQKRRLEDRIREKCAHSDVMHLWD